MNCFTISSGGSFNVHEHGIAGHIVHALMERAEQAGAQRIVSARLRVSELSGATQEALQTAFDHACQEHGIGPFAIELVKDGLLGYCEPCGQVVPADDGLVCMECSVGPVVLRGDETVIVLDCQLA